MRHLSPILKLYNRKLITSRNLLSHTFKKKKKKNQQILVIEKSVMVTVNFFTWFVNQTNY